MFNDDDRNNPWESRMWFRLSKVVYFLIFIAALLFVVVLAYSQLPTSHTYIDSTKTRFICNNGQSYGNKKIFVTKESDLSSYEDTALRLKCEYGDSDQNKKREIPNKNYTIKFFETTNSYGGWDAVLATLLIGLPIVIIVFEIIKRLFLYITIGKNPLKIR